MSSKLVSFFKQLGVHHVFDIAFSRDISLLERYIASCCHHFLTLLSAKEFVERFRNSSKAGSIPMLASACPGKQKERERE